MRSSFAVVLALALAHEETSTPAKSSLPANPPSARDTSPNLQTADTAIPKETQVQEIPLTPQFSSPQKSKLTYDAQSTESQSSNAAQQATKRQLSPSDSFWEAFQRMYSAPRSMQQPAYPRQVQQPAWNPYSPAQQPSWNPYPPMQQPASNPYSPAQQPAPFYPPTRTPQQQWRPIFNPPPTNVPQQPPVREATSEDFMPVNPPETNSTSRDSTHTKETKSTSHAREAPTSTTYDVLPPVTDAKSTSSSTKPSTTSSTIPSSTTKTSSPASPTKTSTSESETESQPITKSKSSSDDEDEVLEDASSTLAHPSTLFLILPLIYIL
ncbi:hypothetical protein DSO57_1023745 [Entomophthora muscae]|uniref:Uncharacterized protein n=1 Tax=Entomophthora muscae TaxID=34485 RepID=A0ACC2S4T7_9FUNG|nr:hypothetical protein DSO57_1023745 [Entomophthora muscae]